MIQYLFQIEIEKHQVSILLFVYNTNFLKNPFVLIK